MPNNCTNALETVTNLSSYKSSSEETSLLSKGLKFIPDRSKIDKLNVLTDLGELERRMRLREYFLTETMTTVIHQFRRKCSRLKRKVSLL